VVQGGLLAEAVVSGKFHSKGAGVIGSRCVADLNIHVFFGGDSHRRFIMIVVKVPVSQVGSVIEIITANADRQMTTTEQISEGDASD
jgi:hypothetical protein